MAPLHDTHKGCHYIYFLPLARNICSGTPCGCYARDIIVHDSPAIMPSRYGLR